MDNDFQLILNRIKEMAELTDNKTIMIGGVATYLYSVQNKLMIIMADMMKINV